MLTQWAGVSSQLTCLYTSLTSLVSTCLCITPSNKPKEQERWDIQCKWHSFHLTEMETDNTLSVTLIISNFLWQEDLFTFHLQLYTYFCWIGSRIVREQCPSLGFTPFEHPFCPVEWKLNASVENLIKQLRGVWGTRHEPLGSSVHSPHCVFFPLLV